MDDILKLLTRSSNLQKSAPVVGQKQIPSAGFNARKNTSKADNAFSEGPVISNQGKKVVRGADDDALSERSITSSTKHSKKRKRDDDGHEDGEPEKHESQDGSMKSHEKNVSLIDENRMSEAECRRVLKQHKLKITLLNGNLDPKSTLAEGSKKEKAAPPNTSRKNTLTPLMPVPLTSFKQLRSKYGISKRLAENLNYQGYLKPTEVQMGSLPILLGTDEDRGLSSQRPQKKPRRRSAVDLLTVAPTGSGKTLAFLIHIIQGLLEDRQQHVKGDVRRKRRDKEVQALIIAPTHELADQIVNEGRKIMVGTGLKISGLQKGMKFGLPSPRENEDTNDQSSSQAKEEEEEGPEYESESYTKPVVKTDVLVSTPMMLVNSISSTSESIPNKLPGIRYLILDEADILLDPLFRAQTFSIWSACSNPTLTTSLWSATIGSSIESLATSFINERRERLNLVTTSNPSTHHQIIRLIVGLKDSAIPNISHRLIYTATEQGKLLALRQMLHPAAVSAGDAPSIQPPFLIFTQTIPRAIALHSELLYDIPLEAGGSSRIAVLHSDLSMTARAAIMAGFRRGEVWILITTDLLSRGVDFRGVNGVVNYDIPNTAAAYVHRVGRTGRQQREGGIAVTFYTKEDIPYVKNIANVISNSEKPTTATATATDREKNEIGSQKQPPVGMEKWLLSALPPVPKKIKKELKRKGVQSRRTFVAAGDGGGGGKGGERAEGEGKKGGKGGRAGDGAKRSEEIEGRRMAKKMRISTKSGYDRTLEQKRKDSLEKARRKRQRNQGGVGMEEGDGGEGEEEWGGFED